MSGALRTPPPQAGKVRHRQFEIPGTDGWETARRVKDVAAHVGVAMMDRATLLERAFQLAATGAYSGASDIGRQLASEGYLNIRAHLDGFVLKRQPRRACRAARDGGARVQAGSASAAQVATRAGGMAPVGNRH